MEDDRIIFWMLGFAVGVLMAYTLLSPTYNDRDDD